MRKATNKDFITKHMDVMFSQVNHQIRLEQEGLAAALGLVAASHFDSVLTKLEAMGKHEITKKSTGLLGFIKVSTVSQCFKGFTLKRGREGECYSGEHIRVRIR